MSWTLSYTNSPCWVTVKETQGLNYMTKHSYEKDQELEPGFSDLQFNFLFTMMHCLSLRNWVHKNYGPRGGEDYCELNYIAEQFEAYGSWNWVLKYEASVGTGQSINTFYQCTPWHSYIKHMKEKKSTNKKSCFPVYIYVELYPISVWSFYSLTYCSVT